MLIVEGGNLAEFSPLLVGRFAARRGLSAHNVVNTILLFVTAWQALTLPDVSQTSDDEDAE